MFWKSIIFSNNPSVQKRHLPLYAPTPPPSEVGGFGADTAAIVNDYDLLETGWFSGC